MLRKSFHAGRPSKAGQSFVIRFRYVPGRHKPRLLDILQRMGELTDPAARGDLLEEFSVQPIAASVEAAEPSGEMDDFFDLLR